MEDIRLPYVGEKVWVVDNNNNIIEVIVKEVKYLDNSNCRKADIKTNKGIYKLYDLFETREHAEVKADYIKNK